MTRAEGIAKLLAEHAQSARSKYCTCGWRPTWPDKRIGAEYLQHTEHLAAALEAWLAGQGHGEWGSGEDSRFPDAAWTEDEARASAKRHGTHLVRRRVTEWEEA
jgi:hypothetical protein